MKEIFIEKRIIYFGSSFRDFFDPLTEGSFWDLLWFSFKCFIFIFIFQFVGGYVLAGFSLSISHKLMTLTPQCQKEMINIISQGENSNVTTPTTK